MTLQSIIRKILTACWIALSIVLHPLNLQAQDTFQKKIHMTWLNDAADIKQTPSDSGFIIASASTDSALAALSLVKTDKSGKVLWNKTYQIDGVNNNPTEVQQTADGGYIVVGNAYQTHFNCVGLGVIFVVKTDAIGTLLWHKVIGSSSGSKNSIGRSIQQTADGYIIVGSTQLGSGGTNRYGCPANDVYMIKLNSSGSIQWTKTFGNTNLEEEGYSVKTTIDGGYILTGSAEQESTLEPGVLVRAGYLLKTDGNGVLQWKKIFYDDGQGLNGTRSVNTFESVAQTTDEGFIISGMNSTKDGKTNYDALLIKTDALGNPDWIKAYHNGPINISTVSEENATEVYQTADGGYAFGGKTSNQTINRTELIYFVKTDTDGNVTWSKTYGEGKTDILGSYTPLAEGGHALVGRTYGSINSKENARDIYLIKTDANGNSGSCQRTTISSVLNLSLSVNTDMPATGSGGGTLNYSVSEKTFLIQDSIGCFSSPVTAYFDPSPTCLGDSTIFSNHSDASLFQWDFGDPSSGISNNKSDLFNPKHLYTSLGTYTITLTASDASGSPDSTVTRTVTILPAKFINAGADITLCSGDSAVLIASGGRIGWNKWNYSNADTIKIVPATTTTYTLVGNNGACYDTTNITVTVNIANASIIGIKDICLGDSTVLTASGGTSFLWSNGDTEASISLKPLNTNTHTYSVVLASDGYCYDTTDVTLTVSQMPVVSILGGGVSICSGQSLVLLGLGGITAYSWSHGNSLSDSAIANPVASPEITTTYTMVAFNGACSDTVTTTIKVTPSPTASVTGNSTICSGDSLLLSATGGSSYFWSTGETGSSITAKPRSSTSYTVSVSDGICPDVAVTRLTVIKTDIGEGLPVLVCAGNKATLSASGEGRFLWNTGSTESSIIISPATSGNYWVTVSNSQCTDTAQVDVTVVANPIANAGEDAVVFIGTSIVLNASGNGSYSWTPPTNLSCDDCPNPIANPLQTTTYSVKVTNTYGCSTMDSVTVNVDTSCGAIFIPDAFSPNNDGQNDILYLRAKCIKNMDFKVYDRWGELVFEATEVSAGWDGKLNNKSLNCNMFVYYLNATLISGKIVSQKGKISLIR